ncbi:MAG: hypothetical protein V1837_04235 [Candidatus Woesearchaeota archaeon]
MGIDNIANEIMKSHFTVIDLGKETDISKLWETLLIIAASKKPVYILKEAGFEGAIPGGLLIKRMITYEGPEDSASHKEASRQLESWARIETNAEPIRELFDHFPACLLHKKLIYH